MKPRTRKDFTPEMWSIYNALRNAKQRCTNKNTDKYKRYGARSIKYLLEENKSRLQVVLEQWSAYMRVKRKYPNEVITINRIDNDGHYEDRNIEWIPRSENNKQMWRDNACNPNMEKGAVSRRVPVKCLTTGEVFESAREAERQTGTFHSNISKVCNGKRNFAGKTKDGRKMLWKYIVDKKT